MMLMYILFYLLLLLLIPLFDTILKNIKNFLSWKRLISFLQTYYDLIKLFRKENQKSQFTSFISFLAPIVILSASAMFLFFIPTIVPGLDINLIVLFHILGLSSIFLMLYAFDNATYFGGLWASREAFVLAIVEPVTILLILAFVLISWGHFDLLSIHQSLGINKDIFTWVFMWLLFITLFTILLAENKRFPFDNPTTHLELTMIHEAMLLETNGAKLGILEIAAKINLIAFINLIIYLIWTNTYWFNSIWSLFWLYIIKVIVLLGLVAFVEVFITKMRLFKYQNVFAFLLFIQLLFIAFYLFR